MNNAKHIFQDYVNQLCDVYPRNESESLVSWLFEEYLELRKSDLASEIQIENIPKNLQEAFRQLLLNKPIQYILGKAPFYGREFLVNPSVLIPRNETEELVHWILQENKSPNLRILDIGTGSGCIPITLDLELRMANVYGMDISTDALEVAKKNNRRLSAQVQFIESDILNEPFPVSNLDLIVSNPPYVLMSEKNQMHRNVLDNEPHLALFVDNDDPLLFYRVIAEKGKKALRPRGRIYFETNEAKAGEVCQLLRDLGYDQIEKRMDLNGKERMVRGIWKGVNN
ncbi:Methylase of polypeptide chain release factors [Mariniradius saccharolyticus AK6]|uniref:Methylase of polypeptide chain release factors n=1 Tax=Mariniradius saccharolyticus AK6 TaxID=1239962 RepID=M7XWL9_9BACT|nr:peptide chain release factor N(5)-glutamine methyltransferase [Mariniradius saccharolyticus]EMS32872.1 Methylase of polypeptide chain release factors [Mariniradius saccharolyticus AK6]